MINRAAVDTFVEWQDIIIQYYIRTLLGLNRSSKSDNISQFRFLQSSAGFCLHRVRHGLILHLLSPGSNPEAGKLPGHRLAELGVRHRVDDGVDAAGGLGCSQVKLLIGCQAHREKLKLSFS